MKHIESIQPEVAAGELSVLLLADATATASLTALLHNVTGCAIPVTADTPQSDVDELVPLAVSILRRHWQTPLTCLSASVADRHPNGDMGAEPLSLADLFRQLIGDRVQGNEAWCIPPVHDNIPAAVSALLERKISGVPELPDGLSFARIFCDSTIPPITELIDDNIGWVMTKALPSLPNLERLELGCKENTVAIALNLGIKSLKLDQLEVANNIIAYGIIGEDIMTFPKLRFSSGEANGNSNAVISMSECRILYFPELQEYTKIGNNAWLKNMPMLEELYMPKLSNLCTKQYGLWGNHIADCEKLWKVIYGKATHTDMNTSYASLISGSCPNLIHLEFGEGTSCRIGLSGWNPTSVLSDSAKLPEFLSNFKTYIAERLSEQGSGLTLTLSQAVRDAIQQDPEIVSIITSKGWTISPAPSV